MSITRGDAIGLMSGGLLVDFPVEADVKLGVDYGAGDFTGTYAPGGAVNITIEDEGVDIE